MKNTNNDVKMNEIIEIIQQLSADAKYYFNNEDFEKLEVQLNSILWWAQKGLKTNKKIIEAIKSLKGE